jgi:RNA polymerase sigma-70 factor (ECF subfamily)
MTRSAADIQDELLVVRCQRRDVAAWDELVARWNDRLYYFLRRLIDDPQEAAVVLQEVWLHVLRGLAGLRHDARLAPWLYTIARRTAMTYFRRHYAQREEFGSPVIEQELDAADDFQLQLDNVELVHFGLVRVGRAEREVLTLFFLEDLSLQEVATVLDIPVGTVKSRLFKARCDLRTILQQEQARHEQ